MTLGFFISLALVIAVIVIATKVREHSAKISRIEKGSSTDDIAATGGTATPPQNDQTSQRE